MTWTAVQDALPPADGEVLVWVEHLDVSTAGAIEWGHGCVELADFRNTRRGATYNEDDQSVTSVETVDPHFSWSGGDNDREWPKSMGFTGLGGYGPADGHDRVTHWMPLPEGPKVPASPSPPPPPWPSHVGRQYGERVITASYLEPAHVRGYQPGVLRLPGAAGIVVHYHDGHGLHYEVRHENGALGHYDPDELLDVQDTQP